MKLVLVVTLLCAAAVAQTKVFVQNDSGYASVADAASAELHKHFKVVSAKKDADLIFDFLRQTHSVHTSGSIDQDGDYSSHTYEDPIIELDVIDAHSGDKLWANSRAWSVPYPNLYAISLFHKVKPPSKKLVDDYLKSR